MDCSSITDFQQSSAIRIAKKFRNLHIELGCAHTKVAEVGSLFGERINGHKKFH